MSNEELEKCVDLLGSFNLNPEQARHIWSKIKDKVCFSNEKIFYYSSFKFIDRFTHIRFCLVGVIS